MNEKRILLFQGRSVEGFQIISPDWKYVYINNSAASQGRSSKEELSGFTMMEKYPGIEKSGLFGIQENCMIKRIPHIMKNEFTYKDGTHGWFYLHIEPVPEGLLILSSDITGQKKAHDEILHLNRVYALLSNINQVYRQSDR